MPANRPNQLHPSSSRRARDTAPASVLQLEPDGPGARLDRPAPDLLANCQGKGAGAVSPSHAGTPSASNAPAARGTASATTAGAGLRTAMDQGTSSSPVPSSTPPRDSAEIRAVGESIPPAVAAIERMTREIHSRYQSLSMLREAAARVGEEIVQLELERDAIERALEAQHLLRTGQTSLERMDVEEAEAAMAARRVS